jgi:membrane associated rhomboid family serine protease
MSGTTLIIALNVLVSLLGFSSARFIAASVLRPYRIFRGADFQNLILSGFIHADLFHLLFNMLTFYFFGPQLEREIGTARLVLLYLAGLLVSSIGTCFQHRNNPNYASLGASGAVLAVLFASIVYFPHQHLIIIPIPIPIPAPLFAVGYLAYTYYAARRAAELERPVATPQATAPAAGSEGTAPAPDSAAAPAAPGTAPAPGMFDALISRRVNRHAHIFGALTGLAFVLFENPGRYRGLLEFFTGGR